MTFASPPVVLDTNVLVAGACRRQTSPAYRILMAVLRGQIPLMLTECILAEYEDVLLRPTVTKLTGLSPVQSRDLKKHGWELMTPLEFVKNYNLENK